MVEEQRDRPTVGLRERKKAATRTSLRTAAVRLARRRGPDAVTVEAICAEADVSPRTFFNHFGHKDDAFFGADPDYVASLVDGIVARPERETPLAAVGSVLADLVDAAAGSSLWHEQLLLLRENPQLVARMQSATRFTESAVADGVAVRTGLPAGDPYVRTLAAMAMTAVRVALTRWLDGPERSDPRRLLDETVSLLAVGLAPPRSPS